MLSSLAVGAIDAWIGEREADLTAALRLRASLLLAGLRAVDVSLPIT
jgi:hypothetical protein